MCSECSLIKKKPIKIKQVDKYFVPYLYNEKLCINILMIS